MSKPFSEGQPPIVVAIPARNEADRIGACLQALAAQPDARRHIAGVAIFANNCTDATADVARRVEGLPFTVDVVEATLPPDRRHIGWARRGAIEAAGTRLQALGRADGIIANTDADSRVQPGWLEALVDGFRAGADAVAGAIDLDPDDAAASEAVDARSNEARYAEAVAELAGRLDPRREDPWPNHIWCWGANFAVRADVLARVGGLPIVDLAEDRALHALLVRNDAVIRHCNRTRVWTSGRSDGRAPGGFADLLTSYAQDDDVLCDAELEPAAMVFRRAAWRGRARRLHGAGDAAGLARLLRRVGAAPSPESGFGALWDHAEATSAQLARQRFGLRDLPAETRRLERCLERLREASSTLSSRA